MIRFVDDAFSAVKLEKGSLVNLTKLALSGPQSTQKFLFGLRLRQIGRTAAEQFMLGVKLTMNFQPDLNSGRCCVLIVHSSKASTTRLSENSSAIFVTIISFTFSGSFSCPNAHIILASAVSESMSPSGMTPIRWRSLPVE